MLFPILQLSPCKCRSMHSLLSAIRLDTVRLFAPQETPGDGKRTGPGGSAGAYKGTACAKMLKFEQGTAVGFASASGWSRPHQLLIAASAKKLQPACAPELLLDALCCDKGPFYCCSKAQVRISDCLHLSAAAELGPV